MKLMAGYVTDTISDAFNKLAIVVRAGNPKHIKGLKDLGRADISMPNSSWESIGKRIEEAYIKAGGEDLNK